MCRPPPTRTTVNLPDEGIDAVDQVWRSEGVDSRSRAVREAVEEYTEANAHHESLTGGMTAVLAFDYAHHEVGGELPDAQHDHQDVRKSRRGFRASRNASERDAAVGCVKTRSLSDGGGRE